MEKTTLYLSPELKHGLAEESKRVRRPQATLIREALGRYLADRPRPLPRSIGIVSDGTLSAGTAKDWVHREWDRARSASRSRRTRSKR